MNPKKNALSVLGFFAFGALLVWTAMNLLGNSYSVPVVSIWVSAVLGAELLAAGLLQKRRGRLSLKDLLGVSVCVLLVTGLGYGLFYSILFIATHGTSMEVCSTPWHWSFGMAQYMLGPLGVVLGLLWLILHLREDRRNIRDLRLITRLITVALGVWAVIDTLFSLIQVIRYRNTFNTWGSHTVEETVKYSLMLLVLLGIDRWLKGWENHWKRTNLLDRFPQKVKHAEEPILWSRGDFAILTAVAAVIFTAGGLAWDTEYKWWNLCTLVGNLLFVCLGLVMTGWLVARFYRCGRKLQHLEIGSWLLAALTVAGAIIWAIRFDREELYPLTGLGADMHIHFAILYFGPPALGAALGGVLIRRLRKRLALPNEKVTPTWVAVAAVLWAALALGTVTILNCTMLRHEVSLSLVGITQQDSTYAQIMTDSVYVQFGVDMHEETRDHRLYLHGSGSWSPFLELHPSKGYYYYRYQHEKDLTEIYVRTPSGGYALAAYRDPSGKWCLVN